MTKDLNYPQLVERCRNLGMDERGISEATFWELEFFCKTHIPPTSLISKETKTPSKMINKITPTTSIMPGTKKALTIELARKDLTLLEVISKVKESFPEAKESSIKIWYSQTINKKIE